MLRQKGRQRGRVKGPVRGLEGIRCRVQRAEWDRRDGLCERVMAGESPLMRVRLGLDTVIARVEWLVHGEPHTADGGGSPWSRGNEVHVHDGEEEVSVILDRVQWDILEAGDPEYPLESPDVSEDEGVDDEKRDGVRRAGEQSSPLMSWGSLRASSQGWVRPQVLAPHA